MCLLFLYGRPIVIDHEALVIIGVDGGAKGVEIANELNMYRHNC